MKTRFPQFHREETTVKKITNIKCSGLKGLENSTIQVASDAVIGRPQNQLFNWPLDSCSNFLCEQTSVSATAEVQWMFEMMRGSGWKLSRHDINSCWFYFF